jgi:hypothetical protein
LFTRRRGDDGPASLGCDFGVNIPDREGGKPTAQLGKTLAVLAVLGCYVRIDTPPDITAW